MVKPRTMPGVMELLPSQQAAFEAMVATITRVYESYGFVPVKTPAVELTDVLLTKTGGETERQVYFVQSTGSLQKETEGLPDLALRFDLTVPLARYVAEHQNDLAFPFRRYQIQPVYRGESPQKGRYREFYQCDIDVIGRETLPIRHDAEMPAVIHRVFEELDVGTVTIRLNHRRLMRGLLEHAGIEAGRHVEVLREIDKLDKRGREATVDGVVSTGGVSRSDAEHLLDRLARVSTSHDGAVAMLEEIIAEVPAAAEGGRELLEVIRTLELLGVPESSYVVDLAVARGLDYYTGTVYETTLDAHPEVGSVCSGGRYDDLAGQYTKNRLPGVGVSIGLTRLFSQLLDRGLIDTTTTNVDVFVTLIDEDGATNALAVAEELRSRGLRVACALTPEKLGKQMRYADRAGMRRVVILGEDERARGVAIIRDMVTGDQLEAPTDEIPARIVTMVEHERSDRPPEHGSKPDADDAELGVENGQHSE